MNNNDDKEEDETLREISVIGMVGLGVLFFALLIFFCSSCAPAATVNKNAADLNGQKVKRDMARKIMICSSLADAICNRLEKCGQLPAETTNLVCFNSLTELALVKLSEDECFDQLLTETDKTCDSFKK